MRNILLLIFLLVNITMLNAQDYLEYYQLIQRATIAKTSDSLQDADSLYKLAFANTLGFSNDYKNALFNRFRITKKIDEDLLIKTVQTGTPWKDLKYYLSQMGISRFATYKKLYRKHKHKKTINGSPVVRLIIRDQLSRSKNFHFLVRKGSDSINAVKLQKLLVKKPDLFDRTKTSWFCTELLNILLIHQGKWKNSKELFFQIREFVMQGKIEPSSIQSMIERASLFEGTFFEIDTLTGELKATQSAHKVICGPFYYSAIYGMEGRLYDRENKKVLLQPRSPQVDIDEINALRNYVFLLDVNEAFPKEKYIFLSEDEYCKRLKFK